MPLLYDLGHTRRTAPVAVAVVRAFCESAYEAGATLGGWDRAALERRPEHERAPGAEAHGAIHPSHP